MALARGDQALAKALFIESLDLHMELVNEPGIAEGLTGLAAVAAVASMAMGPEAPVGQSAEAVRAVRLFGASCHTREYRRTHVARRARRFRAQYGDSTCPVGY